MAETETAGGFYQFPLCLLAGPWEFSELLTLAFNHGVCRFLSATWGEDWRKKPDSFETARKTVGFTGGTPAAFAEGDRRARQFVATWEAQTERRSCLVRVRTDLHFSALAEPAELDERKWRVLVALFSAIGDRPVAKLGWEQIQWRAAGWMFQPSVEHGKTRRLALYSRGQIERTLEELVARHLVFSATFRRRERYWSHRLDHSGIWREVERIKAVVHSRSRAERRRLDDARSAMLIAKTLSEAAANGVLHVVGNEEIHVESQRRGLGGR